MEDTMRIIPFRKHERKNPAITNTCTNPENSRFISRFSGVPSQTSSKADM